MGWIADLLKEIPSAARYKSELEAMERENAQLKAQIRVCQTEVENLRQEVQRRDEVIKKESSHKNLLDDAKLDILKLLFEQPKLQKEQIVQALNIASPVAEFHLNDLRKLKMVKQETLPSNTIRTPIGWSLDQEGTRYLVQHL